MLYRVGRPPDPLSWPPANVTGRYSDLAGEFRVLYAASERRAAFLETLQSFRPALDTLARLRQSSKLAEIDFPQSAVGQIPPSYFEKRIAAFRLASASRIIDLCSPETHAMLRSVLAADLVLAGYVGAFNFGEIIGSDYAITRQIARWAFDAGYDCLVYPSAHDHRLKCWAIFDRAHMLPVGAPEVIQREDPDLIAAAGLFGLVIPE